MPSSKKSTNIRKSASGQTEALFAARGLPVPPEAPFDCPLCPRLVAFHEVNRETYPDFHNGPVDSFGPTDARVLIIGLAPGLKGANATGRPFTGDYAGDLLYQCLGKLGLTEGAYDKRPDDGLGLKDVMITNAVRCVPPQNKPTGAEVNACRPFLIARMEALPKLETLFLLGRIAHDSTLRALGLRQKDCPFSHAAVHEINAPALGGRSLRLVDSYHCSRYNVNTGVLTEEMFLNALRKAF